MPRQPLLSSLIRHKVRKLQKRIHRNDVNFVRKQIKKLKPKNIEMLLRFNIVNGLRHAAKHSPHYRSVLQPAINKLTFKNCKELLTKLPFTTAEMVKENPEQFLAIPKSEVVALDFTYGSTGRQKVIYNSRNDLAAIMNSYILGFINCGLTRRDIVQILYSFGVWGLASNIQRALIKMGILALPTGNYLPFQKQQEFIERFGTTALLGTPSYVYNLAREVQLSEKVKKQMRVIMLGGEGLPNHRREVIEEALGGEVFLNYGMNEVGGGIGSECRYHQGYHIFPNYVFEVIDPETGEAVEDGEYGELVISTLKREAMPLIRYRTGDITRIIPEPCPCGLPLPRIDSLIGRVDDRVIIGSAEKYYPQHFDKVLDALDEIKDYWIEVVSNNGKDILKVFVLTKNGSPNLEQKIIQKLYSIESLRIDIEQTNTVEPPQIIFVTKVPSGAKRRRLVDKRQ